MSIRKEKLLHEIKDILKQSYDVAALKEVIAATSMPAAKDVIKKNPNIDLNTLKKSLQKAGHGGFKQITQQDIDAIKKQLGIPITSAAVPGQQAPNAPGQAPKQAPQVAGAGDNKIERAEIDRAKELSQYINVLPEAYKTDLNKKISDLGISGITDIMTAEKFINDFYNFLADVDKYKVIIHNIGELANKQKHPSPQKAAAGKPVPPPAQPAKR